MVMLLIIGCVFLSVAGCLIFDKLIRLEYTLSRRDWEKDGKPFGIFWVPPEVKRSDFRGGIRSSSAHKRLIIDWLFVTPGWVREIPEAKAWLYAYRILSVVLILMPVWVVLFLEYLT